MPQLIRIALVLLTCSTTLSVHANESAPPQGHFAVDRYDVHYTLGSSGDYIAEAEETTHALTPDGARMLGKRMFSHSTKQQAFDVLIAETIKSDGRRIPVKPDAIETQDGILGEKTFRDHQVTSITFPDLAPGDRVHLKWRHTQKEPVLKGVLSLMESVSDSVPIGAATVTVDAPPGLALQIEAHRVLLVRDESDATGRHLRWTYTNKEIRTPEQAEADATLENPHVFVGNLKSWDEIGVAYAAEHRPSVVMSPAVHALASKITQGATEPRAKAQQIYDWVRKNIRYVATYIGNGAWRPHSTDWILENRYGDCKDHVVILEALLRAAGIESSPALIFAGPDEYRLPGIPLLRFDHVITHIPALGLYVDATAETVPFGLLPANEIDKPVILAYRADNPARTPMDTPENNTEIRTTHVTVHKDGSGERSTEVSAHGISSVMVRNWYRGLGQGKQKEWAEEQLRRYRLSGTADLVEISDDQQSKVSYRNTQHIENFLSGEEIGVMSLDSAFSGSVAVPVLLGRFYATTRTRPGVCRPVKVDETITVRFDTGVSVLRLPRDRHISANGMQFDASYKQTNDIVTAKRTFVWNPPHSDCSAAEFTTLAPTAKKIVSALNTGLAYQRAIAD